MSDTLLMGAVAYDPKVVTIWDGFREWFRRNDLDFDYILYSNYERQVEALSEGTIHVAWNSPLAWLRAERLAKSSGREVTAIAMRDTDCDLTSVVVVRADSGIDDVADLAGRAVGVGAVDSPQATLIPLAHIAATGLRPGQDFTVVHHNVGVGMHGDHIGGERDAARALMAGTVDAACMIDGNHLVFSTEGTLAAGATRILTQTPTYDHCNFTAATSAPSTLIDRFTKLLFGMTYDDQEVRPLLDLEGLKAWRPGRTSGYGALDLGVRQFGFYNEEGNVTASDYRP
ncbi:MAG: phosphate/phosphite/phosphonate ABC transporter substrate-binding protein [Actinomycetota bacterium]|nr:phosphate/phosphite/phosphonate ABC transporter substrate-binding protein [Actinomycetota bacterium]